MNEFIYSFTSLFFFLLNYTLNEAGALIPCCITSSWHIVSTEPVLNECAIDLFVHNSTAHVGSDYKSTILAIEYLANYLGC